MKKCIVEGCNHNTKNGANDLCSTHYSRKRRTGTTDKLPRGPHEPYITKAGYVRIASKDHPLGNGSYVSVHRMVFYDSVDGACPPCHWCGMDLDWKSMHVDHLDGVKDNNCVDNLVPSCRRCNTKRGREGQRFAYKVHIYKGAAYSMTELAKIAGISLPTMSRRLKRMDVTSAVEFLKGRRRNICCKCGEPIA